MLSCRVVADSDSMREERIEVLDRFGARDLLEDSFEISPGFEIVGPGGFDEAVEVGTGFGAMNRDGEHPTLSPGGEGTNGVLDEVRIEWNLAVVEHANELRPLAVQIRECLPRSALRHDSTERCRLDALGEYPEELAQGFALRCFAPLEHGATLEPNPQT